MKLEIKEWFAKKVKIPVNLTGIVERETDKAILFKGEKNKGHNDFKNWIPKSVILNKVESEEDKKYNNSIAKKDITITITQKEKDKIKRSRNGKCIFISFDYNKDIVQKVKSLSKRYYHVDSKEWEVPTRDLNLVLELLQEYNVEVKGQIDKEVKDLMEMQIEFDNKIRDNFEFKTEPYVFQKEGFEFGIKNNKFLLADQQGLGKTKQALDISSARSNQFKHCLIVCGVNDLKWNWKKEIKKHTDKNCRILGQYYNTNNDLRIGSVADRVDDLDNIENIEEYYLITNIETLRDGKIQDKLGILTQNGQIGMSIIDEIHKAKNSTSQQGKGIHYIKTYFKMALTGTPLMNSPLDLYNILKWLDVIKTPKYKFEKRYAIKGGYGGYEVVGYKNLKELKETLHKVQLRRLKSEELDLPDKIWQEEYVELNNKESKVYNEVLKDIRNNIDKIKLSPNPLAKLIRLRQVTAHANIVTSKIKKSSKMERMTDLIKQSLEDNEKVLVFSNWTKVTGRAINKLKDEGITVGELTGNTKDKSKIEHEFQNKKKYDVLVGTIPVMGTGLTLTEASNVIFLDSPWTYADKEQASDRVHRIGTKSTVNIITLIAKNTIDEKIEKIINSKKHYSEQLVEGRIDKKKTEELIDELLS